MKSWRIERSDDFTSDIDAIFDHIVETSLIFGSDLEAAISTASRRVLAIETWLEKLVDVPHRGTRDDDILPTLRHITVERAVYYFTVDDDARFNHVLAVFYGGQDHRWRMLKRMISEED